MNSYHPVLLPWRQDDGDMIVIISENGVVWDSVGHDAGLYKLNAFSVLWPPT